MAVWGAIEVDSPEAAREVLDHTVVASVAHISKLFRESRERLSVACFKAARPEFADDESDPAAPLRWMTQAEELLRHAGADPYWHGLGTLVWVTGAPSLESAVAAVAPVADAVSRCGIPLRCGVAHATEADDPADVLRLAAYRSEPAADGRERGQPQPEMIFMEFRLSDGEQARLARISENRGRDIEPLVREALDLLYARHERLSRGSC